MTLLSYLRNTLHLTGAKLACGEGGCGACTVMVSDVEPVTLKPRHRAVNGCLAPLMSIDGTFLHPLALTRAQHGLPCRSRCHNG
jgi:xanthine dehydrogenase/oxidase